MKLNSSPIVSPAQLEILGFDRIGFVEEVTRFSSDYGHNEYGTKYLNALNNVYPKVQKDFEYIVPTKEIGKVTAPSQHYYLTETTSISNKSGELGGISAPAPLEPYPNDEGKIRVAFSPTFIFAIPSSKPAITWPAPK